MGAPAPGPPMPGSTRVGTRIAGDLTSCDDNDDDDDN